MKLNSQLDKAESKYDERDGDLSKPAVSVAQALYRINRCFEMDVGVAREDWLRLKPIIEAAESAKSPSSQPREKIGRLWDTASMLEFQAKTAMERGDKEIHIATSIALKIVEVMKAAAGPESATTPAATAMPDFELRRTLGAAVMLMLQSGDADCAEFARRIPVEFRTADGAPCAALASSAIALTDSPVAWAIYAEGSDELIDVSLLEPEEKTGIYCEPLVPKRGSFRDKSAGLPPTTAMPNDDRRVHLACEIANRIGMMIPYEGTKMQKVDHAGWKKLQAVATELVKLLLAEHPSASSATPRAELTQNRIDAEEACIDIFRDYDEAEIKDKPTSVQICWKVGQALDMDKANG